MTRSLYVILLAAALQIGCSDDPVTIDAGVDTSVPDQGKTPDAATPDAATPDTKPAPDTTPAPDQPVTKLDGTSSFPGVLEGIWLIGWSGGLNHFSWVKFGQLSSAGSGDAWILEGVGMTANLPFWGSTSSTSCTTPPCCTGKTSWNLASAPGTVQLQMPMSTCNGYKSVSLTFTGFTAAGSYPKGAVLQANVAVSPAVPIGTAMGYKFPATQCNAAMTSCTDPL